MKWANLWGSLWHQGTIYEASVPTVPVLAAIARWREHPDRIMALMLLRDFADGEGNHKDAVDAALQRELPSLFPPWRDEPELVRRALVWILGVVPVLRAQYEDLVAEILPDEHRAAWAMVVEDTVDPNDDETFDAFCELEGWAGDAAWQFSDEPASN